MKRIAKVLVFDKAGDLLTLRRSASHPHYAHEIDFPGGEVEDGETPLQAVQREILEEAIAYTPLQEITFAYSRKLPGVNTQHFVFSAHIQAIAPRVTISWEHESYEWINSSLLLSNANYISRDDFFETVRLYFSDTACGN